MSAFFHTCSLSRGFSYPLPQLQGWHPHHSVLVVTNNAEHTPPTGDKDMLRTVLAECVLPHRRCLALAMDLTLQPMPPCMTAISEKSCACNAVCVCRMTACLLVRQVCLTACILLSLSHHYCVCSLCI